MDVSTILGDREFEDHGSGSGAHGFEPSSSQINDFKIDTCHLLAGCSALLRWGKNLLAQCQDNMTEEHDGID